MIIKPKISPPFWIVIILLNSHKVARGVGRLITCQKNLRRFKWLFSWMMILLLLISFWKEIHLKLLREILLTSLNLIITTRINSKMKFRGICRRIKIIEKNNWLNCRKKILIQALVSSHPILIMMLLKNLLFIRLIGSLKNINLKEFIHPRFLIPKILSKFKKQHLINNNFEYLNAIKVSKTRWLKLDPQNL